MKVPLEATQGLQKNTEQPKQKESNIGGTVTIVDHRPEVIQQQKAKNAIKNSVANNPIIQQKQSPVKTNMLAKRIRSNNKGLPDNLKTGIENLSGFSMDDVKVHYNSNKPAQLQAHAYAQGTDIHLAPNQEKHLPHEAWHVVQQKQGRVQPTKQLKSKVNINDDAVLEKEADVMGAKALQMKSSQLQNQLTKGSTFSVGKIVQRVLKKDTLNIVGEYHNISNEYRKKEFYLSQQNYGDYWEEGGFIHKYNDKIFLGDPYEYKILQAIYTSIKKGKDGGGIGALKSVLKDKLSGEKLDEDNETWALFGGIADNDKREENIGTYQNYIYEKSMMLLKDEENIKSKFDKLKKLKYYKINNPSELKNIIKTDIGTVGIVYGFYIEIRHSLNRINELLPLDSKVSSIRKPEEVIRRIDNYIETATAAEGACRILAKHHLGFENISEKSEDYGKESTKLEDFLTKERSLFMHEAANIAKENGVKGVWKVGDAHVVDMKKIPEAERDYNLVTFQEFYDKYGLQIVEDEKKLTAIKKKYFN